jgi:hypothetical protein
MDTTVWVWFAYVLQWFMCWRLDGFVGYLSENTFDKWGLMDRN